MRQGENKERRQARKTREHLFVFRPTPSCGLSLIHRPQLFPRPRSGDERTGKQARPSSPPIRCPTAHITHALISSALVAHASIPSPHILIPVVISPDAPFSVAHSTPMPPSPRPAGRPGKTPSTAHASGHRIRAFIQTPRSLDKQGRGEERDEGMACGPARCLAHRASLSRCPPCCSLCPSPSRRISPAGAFHLGEAAILGEVIYSAPFSLAHLIRPRLIASSVQRLTVPSGRVSKQARQDGGRSSAVLGSVIVSPPRPVIAPSRPSCRRTGRMASRSRRSARLAVPVFPSP